MWWVMEGVVVVEMKNSTHLVNSHNGVKPMRRGIPTAVGASDSRCLSMDHLLYVPRSMLLLVMVVGGRLAGE